MDHTQPTDKNLAMQADMHAQRLKAGRIERAKSRAKARAAETEQARRTRLDNAKIARALARTAEISDARKKRLEAAKASRTKALATETVEERRKRLEATCNRTSKTKALATETVEECRKLYVGPSRVGNASNLNILTKCGLFVNAPGTYTDYVVSYEIL